MLFGYELSTLIFLPLLAAVVLLLVPSSKTKVFFFISFITCIIQLIIWTAMAMSYHTFGELRFAEHRPWINLSLGSWGTLKADYFIATDGLSFPLIGLSIFIILIALIAATDTKKDVKGFFTLILVINATIIGTFSALDFLLFYLFFEFMLLPMFFLIGIWGGPRREYASIKFFLYTLLGSILILIVMIALYLSVQDPDYPGTIVHSFNIFNMYDQGNIIPQSLLDPHHPARLGNLAVREIAFLFLFIGFAIKLPAVPVHTWLPDAHVEASTPVSVILAALLLKIGGYGLMRIAYPIFPDAALHFSTFIAIVGVISIIYGGLNAMASKDLKRLIAYSSVAHMGFVLLGMASMTEEGVTGAMYQMISHGVISAMLFLLAGVLSDRTHDRTIANYSGLASPMKVYTSFVLIAFFASMGLPGFSGFIGEALVFLGSFRSDFIHPAFAILATTGIIIAAAYYLWTIQRMFFGKFHLKGNQEVSILNDLTNLEKVTLLPLAVLTFFLGVFPQPLVNLLEPYALFFVNHVISQGQPTIPN